MAKRKFIILAGLLPIVVLIFLELLWFWTSVPSLVWVGLILSPLLFVLALIGGFSVLIYYRAPEAEEAQSKRFLNLALYVLVLGVGLAFSYQGFNLFKREAIKLMDVHVSIPVMVKNTSAYTAKDMEIDLGEQHQHIAKLAEYQQKSFVFQLKEEAILKVHLGNGDNARTTEVSLNKTVNRVYIRLDPLQNIMIDIN